MTAWLPRVAGAQAPLAGVRVLDFSELLPGPFLTQALAELGADVLKVERPPLGDPVRRGSPALFAAVNRGKRSLLANLKDARDHSRVLALAGEADVLVESFRPGVLDRLGFDWHALHVRNPRLVYASLSGYGVDGPQAQLPGHDINYLSAAGVIGVQGPETVGARTYGVPMADLNAAVYGLATINAALFQRERTGRGQRLDISITDCSLHWMNARLPALQAGPGTSPERLARVRQRPAYGVFLCGDGQWLSLAALEPHFWDALVRTLPLPEFAGAEWQDAHKRSAASADINAAVGARLATMELKDALQQLAAADIPVAAVTSPDALAQDPQFVAREVFAASAGGALCRFPVRMDSMPAWPTEVPPLT